MKIVIVGAGNLGTHLALALKVRGNDIVQVFSRNATKAKDLAEQVSCTAITELHAVDTKADVVLIAVSDSAIEFVSNDLPALNKRTVVAHTAGSIPMSALTKHDNRGVFYPLQTFSADSDVAWDVIPLLLTASNSHSKRILTSLAASINENAKVITDAERLHLHLCATIANNFSNHMFAIAKRIADGANLDFDLIKPLIRETTDKIMQMSPKDAQTGPAIRGDELTMAKHLDLLNGNPELQDLYRMISKSIRRG